MASPVTLKPGSTTKSATRVFEILEAMRESDRPLSAGDVAKKLGYPMSSAWALLRDLVKLGYLIDDVKRRTYYPSPKLLRLAAWLTSPQLIDPALLEGARHLHRTFGTVVSLAVVHDTSIDLSPLQAAPAGPGRAAAVAARAATCRTVSGRTWLSLRPDEEVGGIMAAHNATCRADGRVVPESIAASVRDIRRAGFGAGPSPVFPGYAVLAFPVEDRTHGRASVINLSGPSAELMRRQKWVVAASRDALGDRLLRFDR